MVYNNYLGDYIISNILEQKSITQQQLADELKISRQTANGLITGKKTLSDAIALRLARFTGKSPEFWLKLASQEGKAQGLLERWKGIGQHTLVDHEMILANEEELLGINNFSKSSVKSASYDIRVSEAIVSSNGKKKSKDIQKNDALLFPVGATAIVQTIEEFNFPAFLLGRIGGMSTISAQGILPILGHQVDPGYKGVLQAVLMNMGQNDFYLKYGESFLSLEIVYLPVTPDSLWSGNQRKNFSENAKKLVSTKDLGGNKKDIDNALSVIQKALTKL